MLKITVALFPLVFLLSSPLSAQIGISAAPMKLEFHAAAGSMERQTVTITNPTSRTLEAGVNIMDWRRDSLGNILYEAPGTLPRSCTQWVQVFPATHFSLPAGTSQDVTVAMNVPANADMQACSNTMLLFTQLNPDQHKDAKGMQVKLTVRVGIQIYHAPLSLQKKEVEITYFSDKKITGHTDTTTALLLKLQNTGQLPAEGKVSIELTHLGTGKKTTLPALMFYTLPGAMRLLSAPLDALQDSGKYSAVALVDYGQDQELKIAELEFQYKKR